MPPSAIAENVRKLLEHVPANVTLVAAAKKQSPENVRQVFQAGVKIIGQNYVQETRAVKAQLSDLPLQWHLIGHLQSNKAKDAAELFDMVQTIDSPHLAAALNKECAKRGKIMEVLIEVNSAGEAQKNGAKPEDVPALARQIATLPNLKLRGLMTMGPLLQNSEEYRPYFRTTKKLFDELRGIGIDGAQIDILSMGMTDSYRVAIEEGATLIRVGTLIFGARA